MSSSAFSWKIVEFGGTNEYSTHGNVLGYERTNSFSISGWFRTTSASGFLISKMSATPQGWGVAMDSGYLKLYLTNTPISNSIEIRTNRTYTQGVWRHFVWTYNGSSSAAGVQCYIDNVDVTASLVTVYNTLSATIINTANLNLGGRTNGSVIFTGALDEMAVYSKVLSAAEVAWIYNGKNPRSLTGTGAPSNLAAWWRMGEGDTYPTLLDSGGSGYNGTMTNMESSDLLIDGAGGNFPTHTAPRGAGAFMRASLLNTPAPGQTEFVEYNNRAVYSRADRGVFPTHRRALGSSVFTRAGLLHDNLEGTTEFLKYEGQHIFERADREYQSDLMAAYKEQGIPQRGETHDPVYFHMRGIDATCPEVMQPAYVYWTVEGSPDYTAAELPISELPCGSDPTDVVNIVIAAWWTVRLVSP